MEVTNEGAGPRPLDPRVRSLWWTKGTIQAILLSAVAFALDFALFFDRPFPDAWPPGLPGGVVAGIVVLLAATVPPVAYRRWRFALRTRDLWIRRGIITRSVSVIPYRRLQFVDTQQGPLDRLFGLAELVVHTAAPGTSGRVPGLDVGEAEELRERLAHLEPGDGEPI